MSKILITGSNGFVGQHLLKSLNKKHECYGLNRTNAKNLKEDHYLIADLGDFESIKEYIYDIKPEIVIHLAAIVHKNNADTSEKNYNFINYECSKYLFDVCKEIKAKFVFFSTIEVYGKNDLEFINETTICEPLSYYAKSKYKAEKYLISLEGLDYTILRPTPLYGKNFTLNIDKRIFLKKNKIAYYFKNGEYKFDFCSIGNVCDIVEKVCENQFDKKAHILVDNNRLNVSEIIELYKKYNPSIKVIKMPYNLCSCIITIIEFICGGLLKKDVYLSKRNFDKLFSSKQYVDTEFNEIEMKWNMENTIYGKESEK